MTDFITFGKYINVTYQIKDRMTLNMRINNTFTMISRCTDKSGWKESIDRAVACGFLTVENVTLAKIQYDSPSTTYEYEIKPTEEGETYLQYLML